MSTVRLGLRENLPQFSLLVLINAFVGAMVGLERTILPLLGEQDFGKICLELLTHLAPIVWRGCHLHED